LLSGEEEKAGGDGSYRKRRDCDTSFLGRGWKRRHASSTKCDKNAEKKGAPGTGGWQHNGGAEFDTKRKAQGKCEPVASPYVVNTVPGRT
jgi:hypothetical protein